MHERVSPAVILKQLEPPPYHVRQAWLPTAFFDLICECELRIFESAKKLRTAPSRDRLQLRAGADNIETVAAEFEQEIAPVLSLAALWSRKKLRRSAAHCDVDFCSVYELSRNLLDIVPISRMRVKSGACWIRQFCVSHKTGGAAIFPS